MTNHFPNLFAHKVIFTSFRVYFFWNIFIIFWIRGNWRKIKENPNLSISTRHTLSHTPALKAPVSDLTWQLLSYRFLMLLNSDHISLREPLSSPWPDFSPHSTSPSLHSQSPASGLNKAACATVLLIEVGTVGFPLIFPSSSCLFLLGLYNACIQRTKLSVFCWFVEYCKIRLQWTEREDVCFVSLPLWSHIIGVCNAVFIFMVLLNGQYQIRSDISLEEMGFLLHSSTIYAVVFLVNVERSFFFMYVCIQLILSEPCLTVYATVYSYACF